MKQDYFIVVLAHSLHGRLKRIQIPHTVVYGILALAVLGCFSILGFISSYARMAWKVANYNSLRREADSLRVRYQNLQNVVNQTNQQMASLQLFASEVSVAYGIKRKLDGPADISGEGKLVPTFGETVQEYNYLKSVTRLERSFSQRFHHTAEPVSWPLLGRLMGPYGERTDPFSGEGAYHRGVDISAPTGTPVKVTADGTVIHADRSSGFGRLVIVDHGNGVNTYYAHLSKFSVWPGQEVRRGDIVGLVGSSGRATAPHLHYEIRRGGVPVNPWRSLNLGVGTQTARKDFPF
jgi:murein DD-endopeptidase MepM/ murein hydrolase activator NlpD